MHCGEHVVSWTNFKDAVALFSSRKEHLRHLFQSSRRFAHHPDFLGDVQELGANRLVFVTDSMFRKSDKGDILEHLFSLETVMSSLSLSKHLTHGTSFTPSSASRMTHIPRQCRRESRRWSKTQTS